MPSDTERLNLLMSLCSPYWTHRLDGLWALIETDCGAMHVRGVGATIRDAIDAAIKAEQQDRIRQWEERQKEEER